MNYTINDDVVENISIDNLIDFEDVSMIDTEIDTDFTIADIDIGCDINI